MCQAASASIRTTNRCATGAPLLTNFVWVGKQEVGVRSGAPVISEADPGAIHSRVVMYATPTYPANFCPLRWQPVKVDSGFRCFIILFAEPSANPLRSVRRSRSPMLAREGFPALCAWFACKARANERKNDCPNPRRGCKSKLEQQLRAVSRPYRQRRYENGKNAECDGSNGSDKASLLH